jgi:hypothetical protein
MLRAHPDRRRCANVASDVIAASSNQRLRPRANSINETTEEFCRQKRLRRQNAWNDKMPSRQIVADHAQRNPNGGNNFGLVSQETREATEFTPRLVERFQRSPSLTGFYDFCVARSRSGKRKSPVRFSSRSYQNSSKNAG